MIIGMVIAGTEAETVWNAFRLGRFALEKGDAVRVFLLGNGVESPHIDTEQFNVSGQMTTFVNAGGAILACGTCLQLREAESSEICPISTMKDLYDIVNESDKLLTF